MSARLKAIAVFFLAVFFAVQTAHTVTNSVHWPINPYNLFFTQSKLESRYYYFALQDEAGDEVTVNARHCLPLETFRLKGICRDVFMGPNEERKERLAALILDYLNRSAWYGFDEIYPPVRQPNERPFVSFDLIEYHYDLHNYVAGSTPEPASQHIVYQYRSPA